MNRKEIIEAWKTNEKPFGLVSKEMQDMAKTISPIEFNYYNHDGEWEVITNTNYDYSNKVNVLRLRSDYKEKSKIVECEVKWRGHTGGDWMYMFHYKGAWRPLDYAVRHNLIGYKYTDGSQSNASFRWRSKATGLITQWLVKDEVEQDNYEDEYCTHVLFKEQEK